MGTTDLIVLAVIGLVVGLIARKILFWGRQGGSVGLGPIIQTAVIGIVGSLLGYFAGKFTGLVEGSIFEPMALGLAVVGTVIVMAIARVFTR